MYANDSCTLYLKSLDYQKVIIDKTFIQKRLPYTQSKMGLSYTENAFSVFKGHKDLMGKFTLGKDFLIKGTSNIVVDNTSDKSRSESLIKIKEEGGVTIMQADYLDYGSQNMRHWELSCR
jgi:hypothetical protein